MIRLEIGRTLFPTLSPKHGDKPGHRAHLGEALVEDSGAGAQQFCPNNPNEAIGIKRAKIHFSHFCRKAMLKCH